MNNEQSEIEKAFLSKQKFSMMIEESVIKDRVSYMDAIIGLCEKHFIDIEDIKKFISTPIKDKLEAEARALNYLPHRNALPFDDI